MDFDFLSSNLQIAYPFQQNVTVSRYGDDTELSVTTAAARIRTFDQRDERLTLQRVYLESTDGFTTFTEADIRLAWQPSGDIINLSDTGGTANATVQMYGSWIVAEWHAPIALSGSPSMAVKLVFPTSVIEAPTESSSSSSSDVPVVDSIIQIDEKTDELTFHTSVVSQGPNKVRRVYWKRGDTLELIADAGEEFIVRAGFNMSIGADVSAETAGERQLTRISINATPGAGFGRYLICSGSEYLLTMNGVGGNTQGELVLNPLECYWPSQELEGGITPQPAAHGVTGTAQIKQHQVRIGNSCGACCSCDDYILTYNNLHRLWTQARQTAEEVYAIRDTFCSVVAAYEDIVGACVPLKLSLSILATGDLYVTVSLCNGSDTALNTNLETGPLLRFDLEFTLPDGASVSYAVGSGRLAATSGRHGREPDSTAATAAVITADLSVAPNNTLIWAGVWNLSDTASGDVVEATVVATDGELPEPRSAAASVTVD